MFKNLTKFAYQKNSIEALEFYIAYNAFFIATIFLLTILSWSVTKFVVAYQA